MMLRGEEGCFFADLSSRNLRATLGDPGYSFLGRDRHLLDRQHPAMCVVRPVGGTVSLETVFEMGSGLRRGFV